MAGAKIQTTAIKQMYGMQQDERWKQDESSSSGTKELESQTFIS